MLNAIICWAVERRILVLLSLLAIIAGSAYSIPKLNLDAFPDVTNVQVSLNTEAPGLAAEEVEQLITFPIESVMYALPDVAEVRSISKTGLSIVTVVFKENTDIFFARQLVFERLQVAKDMIPSGVGTPEMGPNTSGLGQIYQYLLVAEPSSGYDAMALRGLNDWMVKRLLMPVEGVTDVLSFGGQVRQYQVQVNPSKLLAYGVSLEQVSAAIEKNNQNAGGWYLQRGQEQLVIRGFGWLDAGQQGLEQLRQIPVKSAEGSIVRVADVASVGFGSEIRQGAISVTRRNDDNSVTSMGEVVSGVVLKRMGANTNATIEGLKQRQAIIQQALPAGVSYQPFYDQADLIQAAVATVANALLLAFAFIVCVLALFLLNLSATFLVLLSIPVAIGLALMVMSQLGISANLMSLGGLAVAIGMLVDGSVVMVENIINHLSRQTRLLQKGERMASDQLQQLVALASCEVVRPIVFAAAIILVVFIPLFSFEGVEAKLFEPMAASIMLAVMAAVFVAITIVPAMASFVFNRGMRLRRNPVLEKLEANYRAALGRLMQSPLILASVVAALIIGAVAIAPRLGTEFVPELEEGTINLRVTLAPSASLNTSLSIAPKIEQELLAFPEVRYALSRIGRAEIGGDPEPVNNIEIYMGLLPQAQWRSADNRKQLQQLMEAKLAKYPGLLFNFSQPIATRVDELLSGVKAQLAIKLFGPDLAVLASKGKEIEQQVQALAGARDVAMEQVVGEAQLVIEPKRQQLSRYGMSVADVMSVVSQGLGGQSAGQIINGNERYDIYVRLAPEFRDDAHSIAEIRLQSPAGAWLRLSDVANIRIESGPPQIRRDDVQRRVVIQANVEGRDMGGLVADIERVIQQNVTLPAGYSIQIGGQYESQIRAQKRLAMVIPLSVLLIALLLYFAFNSVAQALLILSSVPLAVIGGIFSLAISGQHLSVPSAVGFITLFGVAVLNGVVLVESINQRLANGIEHQRAIVDGAVSRLRPVLMTAITSALGLIPMLLATGAGAEIQKPLASVIIGGLLTATLLTLFVLPCLYRWLIKHHD